MTTSTEIFLADYAPTAFNIDAVFLHFDLQESVTTVQSVLEISRRQNAGNQPLVLDGEGLFLKRIALDGKILAPTLYAQTEKSLTIFAVPDQFHLEIEVEIQPQNNKALTGLYRSRGNYCTQCEAEGFRRITYYLDRPDVLSYFTVTISADKTQYPYLLSNGNLVEKRALDNNRHWVKWHDPSLKPCYLFALVAGDFDLLEDQFVTCSSKPVALQLYVEKGFGHQGDYALKSLKNAMRWDEERFGREYDLDIYMIVAVSDFNMGAMENKGLNIFNTKYVLADAQTATDMDYLGIEAVIGHEYFHNWSGNRVTCRDWFQITLKEGLTVFRDQAFTQDLNSAAVARLDAIEIVRNRQFAEDAGPLSHPIRPASYSEINNFYTVTVYRKGAEVIRMVETLITKPIFRQALDQYFARYDGQAVTTDDFIATMQAVSVHDLTQFKRWYSQKGTPHLDIQGEYCRETQVFTLTVTQLNIDEPFYFPLVMCLMNKSTQKPMTLSEVLIVKDLKQTFEFHQITQEPIPSLFHQFSAPVIWSYPYSDEDLAWLARYDLDTFSRFDALQQLSVRVLLRLVKAIEKKELLSLDPILIDIYQHCLQPNSLTDPHYMSRLLALPSENYLSLQLEKIPVQAIHRAREFVKAELARVLQADFLRVYQQMQESGEYLYQPISVGKRSLKNFCLQFLTPNLAYAQYTQSNNMTDALGALCALNSVENPLREIALQDFYTRWQKNPLVVNKWLTLHASADVPNVYEKVQELMNHEAFDLTNPNNVYALLCTFNENHTHFHAENGEGYALIADCVIKLDALNPQVAARVVKPFTQWKQYAEPHATLMKQALKTVANVPKLSRDVSEVVNKSL